MLDLTRKMLKNEYVYILDCDSETFVWMGKRSLPGHRKVGMAIARKLMDEMDRPAHADIAPQVPHLSFFSSSLPVVLLSFRSVFFCPSHSLIGGLFWC